jgi:glycosyltransferase involved in cell wall biosynthesis
MQDESLRSRKPRSLVRENDLFRMSNVKHGRGDGGMDCSNRPVRTLLFSTLYPNVIRPGHGIFVETRQRKLQSNERVESRVIAPVPWFPSTHRAFGEYAKHAAVPTTEVRHGISVSHPRYLLVPRIGMNLAPAALARAGLREARQLLAEGFDFDLIDAHYFYPDGVAAARIGRALGKPVVITARGSDINLLPDFPKPRAMIVEAARNASGIVAVSSALRDAMIRLGIAAEKIQVLGNGVDTDLFYEEDRVAARARWHADGYTLVSVGNLIPTKGHDLAIRAVAMMPDASLLIAGQGPERDRLQQLATDLGVGARVRLVGQLTQPDLRSLYSAADCLVLASVREGWPNVLLEAMACGASVVASDVGGVAEILGSSPSACLLGARDPAAIAAAVATVRSKGVPRKAAREHAARHEWRSTSAGQVAMFKQILGHSHA